MKFGNFAYVTRVLLVIVSGRVGCDNSFLEGSGMN